MCFSQDCLSFFKESALARQCSCCDSSSSSGFGDVTVPASRTATTICQSDSVIYVLITRLLVFFFKGSAPARQCYYCDSSRSSGSGDVTAPTSCTATTICQSDSVIYVLITRLLVFFFKGSAPARQCYYCDSSSSSGSGDVTIPTSCTATTICQ